jgi:hypothetical protein
MKSVGKMLKKEANEYIAVALMTIFIVTNMKVPKMIGGLIDTLMGRVVVITLAVSLFFVHNVLGVVALVFAYELIRRSEQSTGTYQMRHFLPSEYVKGKHFDAMNQFPVTLEEEMVQKMVPLVDNSVPVYTNYKPVMDKLHHAAKL